MLAGDGPRSTPGRSAGPAGGPRFVRRESFCPFQGSRLPAGHVAVEKGDALMTPAPAPAQKGAHNLPEALARTLRHEVGDLLQTVYATVAILQERLPRDWSLERRVLTDLRGRAEVCKNLLDNVHDLVCPVSL